MFNLSLFLAFTVFTSSVHFFWSFPYKPPLKNPAQRASIATPCWASVPPGRIFEGGLLHIKTSNSEAGWDQVETITYRGEESHELLSRTGTFMTIGRLWLLFLFPGPPAKLTCCSPSMCRAASIMDYHSKVIHDMLLKPGILSSLFRVQNQFLFYR